MTKSDTCTIVQIISFEQVVSYTCGGCQTSERRAGHVQKIFGQTNATIQHWQEGARKDPEHCRGETDQCIIVRECLLLPRSHHGVSEQFAMCDSMAQQPRVASRRSRCRGSSGEFSFIDRSIQQAFTTTMHGWSVQCLQCNETACIMVQMCIGCVCM